MRSLSPRALKGEADAIALFITFTLLNTHTARQDAVAFWEARWKQRRTPCAWFSISSQMRLSNDMSKNTLRDVKSYLPQHGGCSDRSIVGNLPAPEVVNLPLFKV